MSRSPGSDLAVRLWRLDRAALLPLVVAGLLATSAILAALGAPLAASAWLAVAALAAAVTAYLVALPREKATKHERGPAS
jgi:hypothetical protein